MEVQEHKDLLAAIERNTAATRSIAIFMLGWITWFLIGFATFVVGGLIGTVLQNTGGLIIGGLLAVGGVAMIIAGAIKALASSLRELAKSSK